MRRPTGRPYFDATGAELVTADPRASCAANTATARARVGNVKSRSQGFSSDARNFDGLTNDRANLVGDPRLDAGRPREELIEQWFNTAAFAQPATGQDGTAGRSIVGGLGYRNVDLGAFRDVRLIGRAMFQLRSEATNVLNIVNLQNAGLSLNAPATFGRIRSARDMRRIQLGARVSF